MDLADADTDSADAKDLADSAGSVDLADLADLTDSADSTDLADSADLADSYFHPHLDHLVYFSAPTRVEFLSRVLLSIGALFRVGTPYSSIPLRIMFRSCQGCEAHVY